MSDTDGFIAEVTEEVRRERLFGYFKKYGWIAALIIIALVGGTAYYEYSKNAQAKKAQDLGDSLFAALDQDSADGRLAALNDIVTGDDASVVARLLAAADGSDQSVQILTDIAQNSAQPAYIRDLALLRRIMLDAAMPAAEKEEALNNLSMVGASYQQTAAELLALLHIEQGNRDVALEIIRAQIDDATAPQIQVRRLQELILAMGETP